MIRSEISKHKSKLEYWQNQKREYMLKAQQESDILIIRESLNPALHF